MTDKYLIPASIVIAAVIIAGAWVYTSGLKSPPPSAPTLSFEDKILPPQGLVLPVKWGDLGRQLTAAGAIDAQKFEGLYTQRGGLTDEEKNLLYGINNGNLKITLQNSQIVLNLFWAFGLANKNPILESGPMMDSRYGGAGRFASTGGWTLAQGNAMEHYSRHQFVTLTPEQQQMVEKVSKGIYRPCCDNLTYFPDCNHGMAMLGLLELMASQGLSEEEMYKAALQANSFWFPDIYLTIAGYLQTKGIEWEEINPKEILGPNFSSISGYQQILSQYTPPQERDGGSCGV